MAAVTVARVAGPVYALIGIAGFLMPSPLFGMFEVNGLHNIVHLLVGGLLLYGSRSIATAITTTRAVGAALVVLGTLGFVFADGFGLLPLGGHDIWLHLASGAILLAAALMGAPAPVER